MVKMSVTVKIRDFIDALNIQNDGISHYLDTKTGKIMMLGKDELEAVEARASVEKYPDWQQELIKKAQAIVEDENGQYLELPTQFEVNEYAIMEGFCLSLRDVQASDEMYYAIKGSGAFRKFKDKLNQYGLSEDWYKYRDSAFEEIARNWCKENKVNCI